MLALGLLTTSACCLSRDPWGTLALTLTTQRTHTDMHEHQATEREGTQLRGQPLPSLNFPSAPPGSHAWPGIVGRRRRLRVPGDGGPACCIPGLPGTAIFLDPGREQAGACLGQELRPALPQDGTREYARAEIQAHVITQWGHGRAHPGFSVPLHGSVPFPHQHPA